MVATDYWLITIGVFAGAGFFFLIRAGLADFIGVLAALAIRLRIRRNDQTEAPPLDEPRREKFKRSPLALGLIGGLAFGTLWLPNGLLMAWFGVFGVAIGWVVAHSRTVGQEDYKAVETFISTLRSVFFVGQSVVNALETTAEELDKGPLRLAAEEAVRRYRADLDQTTSLNALRALNWPHVTRLATILGQIGRADETTMRQALADLEQRVRTAHRLRDRANTVLTVNRLTLRVLQSANGIALIAVTLLPAWHAFYSQNATALIAVTGGVVAGSAYFANEINRISASV